MSEQVPTQEVSQVGTSGTVSEPQLTPSPPQELRATAKEKTGKNPGRVAAGKRLAQYSKEARERKKREQEESERSASSSPNLLYVIARVVAVSSIAILAYKFGDKIPWDKKEEVRAPSPPPPEPVRVRRGRLASD